MNLLTIEAANDYKRNAYISKWGSETIGDIVYY